MEAVLQETAYPTNRKQAGRVYVAPTTKLRDPNHESELARFHRAGASSANMARNHMTFSILDHHEDGGIILTAKGAVLDLERMETLGEQFVYDTDGKTVHLEDDVPLIRLDDSFGANPRRTMNRFFQKADQPSSQCVDHRLLSMMFWADASRKISGAV